jgi:hypothetical protein
VVEPVLVPVLSGQVYASVRLLVQALRVIRLVAPLVSLAVPLISVVSLPETPEPLAKQPERLGEAVSGWLRLYQWLSLCWCQCCQGRSTPLYDCWCRLYA